MINLTANELEALRGIDHSEYGDCITDPVWSFSVTDNCLLKTRSIPGVVSSLVKKGLVTVSDSGTADACIAMTKAGVEVYCHWMEKLGERRHKHIDQADYEARESAYRAEQAAKAAEQDTAPVQAVEADVEKTTYHEVTPVQAVETAARALAEDKITIEDVLRIVMKAQRVQSSPLEDAHEFDGVTQTHRLRISKPAPKHTQSPPRGHIKMEG